MNQQNINGPESKCNSASGVIDKPFTGGAFIFNKMEEIWKDVIGYEGFYQVSNLGRVKSLERVIIMKNGFKQTNCEIIRKPATHRQGYLFLYLSKNNTPKRFYVHRIVAANFLEGELKEVNHINGVKSDNRLENLEWSTSSNNSIHAVKTGLRPIKRDSESKNSKTNETDVFAIRTKFKNELITKSELAKIYNLSHKTIRQILKYETWKHVQI